MSDTPYYAGRLALIYMAVNSKDLTDEQMWEVCNLMVNQGQTPTPEVKNWIVKTATEGVVDLLSAVRKQ